jgi:hydroxypyruvate reductase
MNSIWRENPRLFLRGLFDAAVSSALPSVVIPPALARIEPPKGRVIVTGAGKASAAMAQAVERNWPGDRSQLSGLVVTRYGHTASCEQIEIVEAAHPVPDQAGYQTAQRILEETVVGLTKDDLVLSLMSGGGSSLWVSPAEGISLEDKQAVNRELLRSGATISEMNCVRKHLSRIKGGRLGLACQPAQVVTLIISDVPGDDPAMVASGPTLPDSTTREEALAVLDRFKIKDPQSVRTLLESSQSETPKPGDWRFARHRVEVVASAQRSLVAAATFARNGGIEAYVLSDSIQGEARDVGRDQALMALGVAREKIPFTPPCVILSGGETTVTVRGAGKGGRNVEYLTALAQTLNSHTLIYALAADTDGVDGTEEIAGAWINPTTIARAQMKGISLQDILNANDGHRLFKILHDSVITGPTLTNVNDFRAILILEA